MSEIQVGNFDKVAKQYKAAFNDGYKQALEDVLDGVKEILEDNAIYNIDCVDTLIKQLEEQRKK